jgi:hypothetical protein
MITLLNIKITDMCDILYKYKIFAIQITTSENLTNDVIE